MEPSTTRRRLLVSTGTAAFAGSLASAGAGAQSDGSDGAEELDPDPLPDDLVAVLDPLPAAVGDHALQTIRLSRPTESSDATMLGPARTDVLGLEAGDVDRFATATYGGYERRLLVATGSFDEADVDPSSAAPADGEPAVDVSDGTAVLAVGTDGGWSDGLDAATDAAGDDDAGVLAEYSAAALLDPLAEKPAVSVADLNGSGIAEDLESDTDVEFDDVEIVAVAEETVDQTTLQLSFVVLFDSADAVDDEVTTALVESGPGQDVEVDGLDTVGRRTIATVQRPLPDHRLPDDSPDLRFRFAYAGDGTVEIEADGEESAEPANLELLVDGEPVEDPPWADRSDPIEPGTTLETAADLFSVVRIEWIDPEREGVSHTLGETMLGAHRRLFEESYDHDASELTITYEGEETVDAGRLELTRRGPDQLHDEAAPEPLDERVDRLSSGTEIVLEDVTYGDTVSIRATAEHETSSYVRSVHHYRARAPGRFEFTHEDGVPTLVYRGREPQPASAYRMTVPQRGGRRGTARNVPLDVQWTDEYETVSPGDTLALGDVEVGTYCRVEWTGTDEPVHVDSFRVEPHVEFSTTYDEAADAVEFAHDGGQSIDADRLAVTVYVRGDREEYDVFDESEQVTEGDSETLELPGDPDEQDADRHRAFLVVEYGDGMPIHFTNVDRSGASDA